MFKSPLVTTDGSDTAASVLPHVAHVTAPDGVVTVVAVIDDAGRLIAQMTPAGFEFGAGIASGDLVDQAIAAQRAAAEKYIAAAKATLTAAGCKQVEGLILSGAAGEAIVNAAQERKADIVLMATHGRSGIKRAVLGSVAEHVLRHLEGVPVLLLNPKA